MKTQLTAKKGTKYKVTGDTNWAPKGAIVTLKYNDKTDLPLFRVPTKGDVWLSWENLSPLDDTTHVDDVFESLSEGQRTHMLNKLAKHGYDKRHGATIVKRLSDEQKAEVKGRLVAFVPPVPKPEKTYRVGDTVPIYHGSPRTSAPMGNGILCSEPYGNVFIVSLSPLTKGKRWNNKIQPKDISAITQDELDKIS